MKIYSMFTYPKNFLFVSHVGIKDAEIYADFKIEKALITAVTQIFFQTMTELNFILRFIYDNFVKKNFPIFSTFFYSSCDFNDHF
jgi:hypothetical protein